MFLGCHNFVICKQSTKHPTLVTRLQCHQIYISGPGLETFDEVQMFCCPETLQFYAQSIFLMKLGLCMLQWRIIKRWCINIQNPNPATIIHRLFSSSANSLLFLFPIFTWCPWGSGGWLSWSPGHWSWRWRSCVCPRAPAWRCPSHSP